MNAKTIKPRGGRRRSLLDALGIDGTLVTGWGMISPRSRVGDPGALPEHNGEAALNGWVKITPEGDTVLAMSRVEMGQGIRVALSMLAAEEPDIPLSRVYIESAPVERIYGNVAAMDDSSLPSHPDSVDKTQTRALHWIMAKNARGVGLIITDDSDSTADGWQPVCGAAVTARAAPVQVAAHEWNAPVANVSTRESQLAGPGGEQSTFGKMVKLVRSISTPLNVMLKPASQFRLIGKPAPYNDLAAKTDGNVRFSIDTRLSDMLYVTVVMCPVFGGKLRASQSKATLDMPGIRYMMPFEGAGGSVLGMAVVADHYRQARQAFVTPEPMQDNGPHAKLDSAGIRQQLVSALDSDKGGFIHRSMDDGLKAFDGADGATIVEAEYSTPYLAHAAVESINCTAQVTTDGVHLWAPTQVATLAQLVATRAAGMGGNKIQIDITLVGGDFGRQLKSDLASQAVTIATKIGGKSVQVIWSREEDVRHDLYRSQAIARLKVRIENGKVTTIIPRSAGQSILAGESDHLFDVPSVGIDRYATEGLFNLPHEIEHGHIAHLVVDLPVPVGFWRSVGRLYNGLFIEGFLSEVAATARFDPLTMRCNLLKDRPRELKVLDTAAQAAGWGQPPAPAADDAPRTCGITLRPSLGSVVAQVTEVSMEDDRPRVHRVMCAVDHDTVVSPDIVVQWVEGVVISGLVAVLYGRVDIKGGQVVQSNFSGYPALKMVEIPVIETHIVPSTAEPSGMSEVGVPLITPTVVHAMTQLTDGPVRQLPMV